MDYIGKRQIPNVCINMQDGLNDIDQKQNTPIGSTVRPHHSQCHVVASRLSLVRDVYTS
jgi:hypothetical protein